MKELKKFKSLPPNQMKKIKGGFKPGSDLSCGCKVKGCQTCYPPGTKQPS